MEVFFSFSFFLFPFLKYFDHSLVNVSKNVAESNRGSYNTWGTALIESVSGDGS